MSDQEAQQDDDAQAQEHGDAPQQQVRLLNPARARHRLFGDLLQLGDDLAQSRTGKPFLDAVMERLDGLNDLPGFEAPEFGAG